MDLLQQAAFSQRLLIFGMMSLIPVIMVLHLLDSVKRRRNARDREDRAERLPRKTFHLFLGITVLAFLSLAIGCLMYFAV